MLRGLGWRDGTVVNSIAVLLGNAISVPCTHIRGHNHL